MPTNPTTQEPELSEQQLEKATGGANVPPSIVNLTTEAMAGMEVEPVDFLPKNLDRVPLPRRPSSPTH